MQTKDHLFFLFIIVAITLCAYYPSFNNSFMYDDYPFVVENKAIRELTPAKIASIYTDKYSVSSDKALAGDIWRPLTTSSFALDYRFWKLKSPRPYHAENTVLHAVNAMLVYLITLAITGSGLGSLLAGVIFAVHPVQTEAVGWISGRANVLFLFFFLLSFLMHIKDKRKLIPSGPYYGLSLIFFAASLLSKEMAVTLPVVCILYDVFFTERKSLKEYAGYYMPFFLVGLSYVIARYSVLGSIAQKSGWWGDAFSYHALTMLKALAGYIRVVIIPTNLRIYYPVDISRSLLDPETLAAVIVLFLSGLIWFKFRGRKTVLFYILWFGLTLAPVSNIIPFKAIMAERFMYLPMIAFASLAGLALARVIENRQANKALSYAAVIAAIVLVTSYVFATVARNVEWTDELVFYMQEAARTPDFPKARYNLGYAYFKKAEESGRLDNESVSYYMLAIKEFTESAELNPYVRLPRGALANTYGAIGNHKGAIDNYKKAISIEEDSDTYNNLAVSYGRIGQHDKALRACKRAIYLTPDHEYAWINLGNSYERAGHPEKAKRARVWSTRLSEAKDKSE